MSDEKVVQVGFAREAIGRGWSDILDNQVVLIKAMLYLVPPNSQTYDIRQGLEYRLRETASYLMHGIQAGTAVERVEPQPPND